METVEQERLGTTGVLRRMGPLVADHPLVRDGTKCPACHEPFLMGQAVTLIALGPGADKEQRKRCWDGRAYNAVAACVHWACATGESGDG